MDDKIVESNLFLEKLQSVEDKLDNFRALEREAYTKDSLLEKMNCKVTAIENTLDEKNKIINTLLEKIEILENKQVNKENETHEETEL